MLGLLLVLAQSIVPLTNQRVITPTVTANQIWARPVIDQDNKRWFCYSQGTDTFLMARNEDGTMASPPQRVNQTTNLQQDEPEIYIDAVTGNLLVVWSDRSHHYSAYMMAMGRGYSVSGVPLTGEFPLVDITVFTQTTWRPIGYSMPNGGFAVVATTGFSEDVCLNFVRAESLPNTPGVIVNSPQWSSKYQEYPCVAVNSLGKTMVAWREHNGAAVGTSALPALAGRLVPDVVPERLLTDPAATPGSKREPRLVAVDQDFFMIWESNGNIWMRRFDALMNPVGNSIIINEIVAGTQRDPQGFAVDNAAIMVVWESIAPNGGGSSVQCRLIGKTMQFLTGDVQASTLSLGVPNVSVQSDRSTPAIFIKNRRVVVTWGGNGVQKDVYYREFLVQ